MKKIPKEYHPKLSARFISLDRDDLDEIVVVLEEIGSVRILSGDYEFEGFDELKSKFGNNPPDLTILLNYKDDSKYGFEREFKLAFPKNLKPQAYFPHEPADWHLQILEILSNKANQILEFFASGLPSWILLTVTSFGFGSAIAYEFWALSLGVPLGILLGSLIIIFFYTSYRDAFRPWSIDLNYRHRPKFWDRHKEKIGYIVLGTIIAAIINFLIKYLFS